MATNFPTSLDTFTNPNSGNTLDSPSHSVQHSDINDAVEAIEAKLGVGSSTAGSATAGYALVNTSGGTTAYSLLGVSGLSSGTAVANTVLTANGSGAATFARTAQGLTLLIPSSVTVGSGTGTVSATGTVDFSGASSVSLNNVFSATYKNYQIEYNITGDANRDLYFRFRASGTDKTTGYYRSNLSMKFDSTTITGGAGNNIGFHFIGVTFTTPLESAGVIQVQNPFDSAQRSVIHFSTMDNNWYSGGGFQVDATSFDGFTIYPVTGNITGSLSVYGYNK